MKLIIRALQTPRIGVSGSFRTFSTYNPFQGTRDAWKSNSAESDDSERRMFGDISGNGETSNSFYQKLDRAQESYSNGYGPSRFSSGNFLGRNTSSNTEGRSPFFDDLDISFNSAEDGMDEKLKKAAYFEVDDDEIEKEEEFHFRPDVEFHEGNTYDPKDLDLRRPAVQKPMKRYEFETTTEEVLQKADFRNVRFLANFITESGIINKRSKTRISAKAQRKIAREIKTARAFGLMPFTTMGTKRFMFGRTMENVDEDFEFGTYRPNSFVDLEGP